MQRSHAGGGRKRLAAAAALSAAIGVVLGAAGGHSLAEMAAPTEHKGLTVETLGVIPGDSMQKQLGLSGYKLQLREITIAPGGQIAKHSHETRPGLVKVISGTWTEGRPGGEMDYAASDAASILEDSQTVHWFWNRGAEPAAALVCDIVAAE
jgi:quercetin dioxygenase-like cupin family protein